MKDKFYLYEGRVMGFPISVYGMNEGYMDYRCLGNIVNEYGGMILNNYIQSATTDITDWETFCGSDIYYIDENDNIRTEEEYYENGCPDGWSEEYNDVYQQFMIGARAAEILKDYTNETVLYSEKLDVYLWNICHYGTSWDYVLTNIAIKDMKTDI